jgi:hypothetical protein
VLARGSKRIMAPPSGRPHVGSQRGLPLLEGEG